MVKVFTLNEYYLVKSVTATKVKQTIYSKVNLRNGEEVSIGDILANPKNTDFIIADAIKNILGTTIELAGNKKLMQAYLQAESEKLGLSWKLNTENNRQEKDKNWFTEDSFFIDGYLREDINFTTNIKISTNKIKALTYSALDLVNVDNQKYRENILRAKIPGMEYVRSQNDMNWLYNNDGSLKKNYKLVETEEELAVYEVMIFPNLVKQKKVVAIDSETHGLLVHNEPNHSGIVGTVITWESNQSIYVPHDHEKTENLPVERLKYWLENWIVVTHNGLFDGLVYYHYGIELNIRFDTLLAEFYVNAGDAKKRKDLKTLADKYLNAKQLSLKKILGKGNEDMFHLVDREMIIAYACPDSDSTYQILPKIWKQIPNIQHEQYHRDIMTLRHLIKVSYDGNKVDTELYAINEKIALADIERMENEVYNYVGRYVYAKKLARMVASDEITAEDFKDKIKTKEFYEAKYEFNIGSDVQLGKVMFDIMGYPYKFITESGQRATSAKQFKYLLSIEAEHDSGYMTADIKSEASKYYDNVPPLVLASMFNRKEHPFPLLIRALRDAKKEHGTFLKMLKGERVFSDWKMTNAETGRIIDKIQTLKGHMKTMIIPTSKDYYMVVFDAAAIEYRHLFGVTGEQDMVDKMNNPEADVHTENASNIFKMDPWDVDYKTRKHAKAVGFGTVYGLSPYALSTDLGIKLEEAENLQTKFLNSIPHAKTWLNTWQETAMTEGISYNFRYRSRKFDIENAEYGVLNSIGRQGKNFPIQSGAREVFADGFNNMCKEMHDNKYDMHITALVHDEFVMSVHRSIPVEFIYDFVERNCMLDYPGHPKYYYGISVVDNWEQGKDDEYEAPIKFVMEKIAKFKNGEIPEKTWETDPRTRMLGEIKEYYAGRIMETYGKYLKEDIIDADKVLDEVKEYFLRGKFNDYFKPVRKADTSSKGDIIAANLEALKIELFGVAEAISTYGKSLNSSEVLENSDPFAMDDMFNLQMELDMQEEIDADKSFVKRSTRQDKSDEIKFNKSNNIYKSDLFFADNYKASSSKFYNETEKGYYFTLDEIEQENRKELLKYLVTLRDDGGKRAVLYLEENRQFLCNISKPDYTKLSEISGLSFTRYMIGV